MKDFLSVLREANAARNKFLDPLGVLGALFFSNELGGEAGEAQNAVKKLVREDLVKRDLLRGKFSTTTVEALAEELADVIICCDLLAMQYGIDLRSSIARKWNATSAAVGIPNRITFHEHFSNFSNDPNDPASTLLGDGSHRER